MIPVQVMPYVVPYVGSTAASVGVVHVLVAQHSSWISALLVLSWSRLPWSLGVVVQLQFDRELLLLASVP